MKKPLGLVAAALAALLSNPAAAVTYVVASTADSGVGSLRQAILDANGSAGADTIAFAIGTGVQTIALASPLPNVTDLVTIDGSTQPGYAGAPLIVLNGTAAGASDGLVLAAGSDASSVRALVIGSFSLTGIYILSSGVSVRGCYIGTDATGTAPAGNGNGGITVAGNGAQIGGFSSATDGNVISGSSFPGVVGLRVLAGISGVVIYGNRIGTDATGTAPIPNSTGLLVAAPAPGDCLIGTGIGFGRNVISGNTLTGVRLTGAAILQGNYIGVDATGTAALPNGGTGVYLDATANGATIGTSAAGARNLISGNGQLGVELTGATGVSIASNYIGLDKNGVPLPNSGWDIRIAGSGNYIGGGSGANMMDKGITVATGTGNVIMYNLVLNGTPSYIGIDLGNDGPTANDACDADAGANNLQNAPVLSLAYTSGGVTTVIGSLDSAASTTYRLQFFASSGIGKAEQFLGGADVTTDAFCDAPIYVTGLAPVAIGLSVVATATVNLGGGGFTDTSELSAPFVVTPVELVRFTAD